MTSYPTEETGPVTYPTKIALYMPPGLPGQLAVHDLDTDGWHLMPHGVDGWSRRRAWAPNKAQVREMTRTYNTPWGETIRVEDGKRAPKGSELLHRSHLSEIRAQLVWMGVPADVTTPGGGNEYYRNHMTDA